MNATQRLIHDNVKPKYQALMAESMGCEWPPADGVTEVDAADALAYTFKGFDSAAEGKSRRKRLIETTSEERKQYPMATGLLDYFPDALAEVARLSYISTAKHHPGEPMHHERGKSADHADCIMRHLAGRGGFDGDTRESAALAWRALALLQEELEQEHGFPYPRGAK